MSSQEPVVVDRPVPLQGTLRTAVVLVLKIQSTALSAVQATLLHIAGRFKARAGPWASGEDSTRLLGGNTSM